jgi:Family of unknown function (DUF5762)
MSQLNNSEFTTDISGNIYDIPNEFNSLLVPFWSENPNIIFNSKYIMEFFPIESMTYNQKLNAISRTILFLTIVSFVYTRSFRILFIGAITLFSIYLLHYYHVKESQKNVGLKNKVEGFEGTEGEFQNPALEVLKDYPTNPITTFDAPSSENPFSNVLMPDYDYNPKKKPAPPAFNTNVNATILDQAKQLVIDQNPGQPDIADKLFTDLGEQFVFEQSLQPFYSNPATTIPNDQAGFSDFCYGSMVSCKEGNLFACARNLDRYTN